MSTWEALLTILGMVVVTVVTRSFFMIPDRELPMPAWLKQGLRYAPLAAMAAIVVPEIVMTQGQLIDTLKDARLYGAAAGTAWYFWRGDILGTIVSGTAVMLALRLGLGW
jgi:branched-subunit amino acid transport protein